MAERIEAIKEVAKAKYVTKVCGFLGIDMEKCGKVFERLYENMKKAFDFEAEEIPEEIRRKVERILREVFEK